MSTQYERFAACFDIPEQLYFDEVKGKHFVRNGTTPDLGDYWRAVRAAIYVDTLWDGWKACAQANALEAAPCGQKH